MKDSKVKSVEARNRILSGDPLLRFFYQRNFSPLTVIVGVILYASIYSVIIPLLFGDFNQVARDWPGLLRALVTTPLLVGYYAWQPLTIQHLYDDVESRSLGYSDAEAEQIVRLLRPLGYKVWTWIGAIFGVIQAVFFYISLTNGPRNWQNESFAITLLATLMTFLSFYAVFQTIIRQIIAMIGINNFFKLVRIEISPLHPDRAGGLKSLGQYSVTIGLGIGVIGLALGVSILRAGMQLEQLTGLFIVNIGLYLVLAPFFFFIPLLRAHQLMQNAKRKIMLEIAEQYESMFQGSLTKLKSGEPVDKDLSQMESIRKMYTIADDSPEWPFNYRMFSQFSAAALLPIFLPIVINYLSDVVKGWLGI